MVQVKERRTEVLISAAQDGGYLVVAPGSHGCVSQPLYAGSLDECLKYASVTLARPEASEGVADHS